MTTILNVGLETRVNTYTNSNQQAPQVSALADGGYIVVWQSDVQDGDGSGIYAQRYDSHGHKTGVESHISTATTRAQYEPAVTGLADGGYFVVWTSTQNFSTDQFGQRYDASGNPVGGETALTGGTISAVTGLADGGYVITSTGNDSDDSGVFAQRFDANGVAASAPFVVNTFQTGEQSLSTTTALNDGGFVIAWRSYVQDGSSYGLYAQRYNADGSAADGEFQINTITAGGQDGVAMAGLADGGFIITWQSGAGSIEAQRYEADGTRAGGEVQVNIVSSLFEYHPTVTALTDGGYIIAWSADGTDGDAYGIYARHYDSDGNPVGGELHVSTYTAHNQDRPSVAALADGGFVVTWESQFQDGSLEGVYQKVYAGATSLAGSQTLFGSSDSDILDGGGGGDKLYGGFGDDIYVVHSLSDVVNEYADQGTDEVQSYVTYTLSADVENLTLMGASAINGAGNGTDNVLQGNSGANTLLGLGGNDTLEGGSGNDLLNGGTGDDVINGGNGNDIIYASDGADFASGDSGIDTYDASTGIGAVKINLATKSNQDGFATYLDGFENVVGTAFADSIAGTSGDNVINGGAGADLMSGGLGDDTYYVDDIGDKVAESSDATLGGVDLVISTVTFTLGTYIENLTLAGTSDIAGNGNTLDNVITGNSGNNILDGKAGNDTLIGGTGDDTYVVDVAGDTIVELAGQGTDTVKAAFSYILSDNLENLVLTGTGNINGTGNAGANTLTGNAGNNILDGGAGADTMAGGLGDDTYIVDNVGDIVTDFNGAGNDIILSSVTYGLNGRYVETLQLTGSANINASGNNQNNILIGNTGNNALSGGTGADTFVFQLNSHADTITDFKVSESDSIDVSAYHAVGHTVTQSGTSVIIDFGSGNTVTVLHTVVADVTAHTVF